MPEASYTTTAKVPVETIWDYVQEMDNWAPFLRGYQGHEKESERDSVWTLKGDLGVMSRTLKFRVHITEWAGPSRVAFDLTGLNEQMNGGGSFVMEPFEEEGFVLTFGDGQWSHHRLAPMEEKTMEESPTEEEK